MSIATRVLDILLRAEQLREQGIPPKAEDLCRECPELLGEVRRRLGRMGAVNDLLDPSVETMNEAVTMRSAPRDRGPLTPARVTRYRLLRRHARGGLGEVLIAFDTELGREVALKRLQPHLADDPLCRRRFLREAEITSRLEHPGIVPVHGLVYDEAGRPYYAMRFIRGESLKEALLRFHQSGRGRRKTAQRRLTFRALLGHFVAACQTVAYAHSRGVIHRDLKPANVMLGLFGETLVVDWGLALESADAADPASEGLVGTLAFLSPEQAEGGRGTPAGDVFSLGATLYNLLVGRPPLQGKTYDEVLAKARAGRFRAPRQVRPGVPRALEAICLKAMARRPEDRYASAQELARDVERYLAGEPVSAWREPWTATVARQRGGTCRASPPSWRVNGSKPQPAADPVPETRRRVIGGRRHRPGLVGDKDN